MEVSVRSDLLEAHREAWAHACASGSWYTGAQRRELATTVLRAIADDDPLPPWVGATTTDRVPSDRAAPDTAHDLAYRIARHASTITEPVFAAAVGELGELPYVEVCGLVSSVSAVAAFHRNVGRPLPPLPDPTGETPTGARPVELVRSPLNWVMVRSPGSTESPIRFAFSAVPGEDTNLWRLGAAQYMPEEARVDPTWKRRHDGMNRPQMELVATKVAQLRECFY